MVSVKVQDGILSNATVIAMHAISIITIVYDKTICRIRAGQFLKTGYHSATAPKFR
jgi:hypothetical protein